MTEYEILLNQRIRNLQKLVDNQSEIIKELKEMIKVLKTNTNNS